MSYRIDQGKLFSKIYTSVIQVVGPWGYDHKIYPLVEQELRTPP